jgi:hypothetical protein
LTLSSTSPAVPALPAATGTLVDMNLPLIRTGDLSVGAGFGRDDDLIEAGLRTC